MIEKMRQPRCVAAGPDRNELNAAISVGLRLTIS
jgi:hypothetical protein